MWWKFSNNENIQLEIPNLYHQKSAEEQDIDFFEHLNDVSRRSLNDFVNNPNKQQSWRYVDFNRLKKIWSDFARQGFVRDVRGLNDIADVMIENTFKLYFNTTIAGHADARPSDFVKQLNEDIDYSEKFDFNDDNEKLNSQLENHLWNDNFGYRISDYALKPLLDDAYKLKYETQPEKQIYIIDRMLNTIHQRNDLSKLFLKGGSKDLTELSGLI